MREILAGDKQLAKEIEFDLRKLESQSHHSDLDKDKRSKNNRASEPESLISTETTSQEQLPQEPEVNTAVQENKDQDEEANGEKSVKDTESDDNPIPNSPIFKITSNVSVLLKKVLINNQRRSIQGVKTSKDICDNAADNKDSNTGKDREHGGNNVVPNPVVIDNNKDSVNNNKNSANEISEKGHDSSSETKSANEKDTGNEYCVTPIKSKGLKIRENLMRAISTPNPTQKLISDITFVNNSQNLSSITLSDAEITKALDKNSTSLKSTSSNTLLLHFRSPEAFAKDEQFSRLRRASQKDLKKLFNIEKLKEKEPPDSLKEKEPSGSSDSHSSKHCTKRPSGGFMETFDMEESQSTLGEDDSTLASQSQSLSKKRRNKFK